MPALQKINDFPEQLLRAKHDFGTHVFKVALTNTAPTAASTALAEITQVAASGGYVSGGYSLDSVAVSETGGTAKVTIADEVITATGGAVGPFRYAVVYNDTSSSKLLVGYVDRGESITLADGDSLTLDFDGTNGVITLA